jgi:Aspartyl/Asparaginyl beta-hydroxylase
MVSFDKDLASFAATWRNHVPNFAVSDPSDSLCISKTLGYLPLHLGYEIPHAAMLEEAKRLSDFFVLHRSAEHHKGWRSLCIHGLSSQHTLGHKDYGYDSHLDAPYSWTDICKFCPITYEFFKEIFEYESYERIRFMLLEPGGFTLPHIDVPWTQLAPINIALNAPDGCEFVMQNWGTIPFPSGAANILAIGHPHAVWNRSNEPRFHIIVHGIKKQIWQHRIIDSYARMGAVK